MAGSSSLRLISFGRYHKSYHNPFPNTSGPHPGEIFYFLFPFSPSVDIMKAPIFKKGGYFMSTHISAKPGEIAEKILIQAPGTKVAPTPGKDEKVG
jgi:hypothetical protein